MWRGVGRKLRLHVSIPAKKYRKIEGPYQNAKGIHRPNAKYLRQRTKGQLTGL